MPHRFPRVLVAVLLGALLLMGCDRGAPAPAVDDISDGSDASYTPPPDPGAEARAAFERGKALLAQGELEQAITQFGEAVTLEPRYARAYLYRARARDAQGAAALALVDADNAILHDPRLAEAYRFRAELYERRYYLTTDAADKHRADQDRERHEKLVAEQTARDLAEELDKR